MAESSARPEKSQYHHYIPRFILRNYSHMNEQQPDKPGAKKRRKRNGKSAPNSNPSEPMLYGIDLSGEEPVITETTVAKTFGLMDMYRDSSTNTKQHHIEQQLSVLESQASAIISLIRKGFEAGDSNVWITRAQRNTLRKFLFIMKYRSVGFHKRYCHETVEDYNEDDNERMKAYMKEKGFKRPIDVWFDNIKGILDLKMDYEKEWMRKLMKRIYSDDAKMFINNAEQFSMAFVTPTVLESEFLLSQGAYSIYEGATSENFNPASGKMEVTAYTEFHLFAPISPRLLIVLRTFILPVPNEDACIENKIMRQRWFDMAVSTHNDPEAAGHLLRDLPIGKARNSYSKIIDGRVVPIDGGPKGVSDKFCFSFLPLADDYVDKINGVMLDECYRIDLIVFNSKVAVHKTLVQYIVSHSALYSTFLAGLLRLAEAKATRVQTFRKLQSAVKLLASDVPVSVTPLPAILPLVSDISSSLENFTIEEFMPEDKLYSLFAKDKTSQGLYTSLSEKSLDTKDFDQVRALLWMRIKLDTNTKGLPEETREQARDDFLKVYDDFPAQVVWLYLKRLRFMKLGYTVINVQGALEDSLLPVKYLKGPEDTIAVSKDEFRKKDLCRAMHHASHNDFIIAKHGRNATIGRLPIIFRSGAAKIREESDLVFGPQGSICDCGIPKVEIVARDIRDRLKANFRAGCYPSSANLSISTDEQIELLTRNAVRQCVDDATGKRLVEKPDLERVVFDVLYPLFESQKTG